MNNALNEVFNLVNKTIMLTIKIFTMLFVVMMVLSFICVIVEFSHSVIYHNGSSAQWFLYSSSVSALLAATIGWIVTGICLVLWQYFVRQWKREFPPSATKIDGGHSSC
tara:strand:+ start:102 stop:428 length:327 start_codon:yes stop_codon:yes gene_type:complete